MTEHERIQLRCPTCGYDLRASLIDGELFRCPECGAYTNTEALLAEHARRKQTQGRWMLGLAFMLCLIAAAVFAPMAFPPKGIRVSGPLVFVNVLVFAIFMMISLRWHGAPLRMRLIFAAVATGLVVLSLAPFPLGAISSFGLVFWLLGYHAWAAWWGYL